MIHTAHKIWQLPLLLLVLWLGGCAMQFEDFDEPAFVAPGDLSLVMDVHTGDRNVKATRAYEVTFEPTNIGRELLNSLRVIIVKNHADAPDTIIHNDPRDLTVPSTFVRYLKYAVEYDSNYTVYLIGNESGLPDDIVNKIKALTPGTEYGANYLEDIKIGSAEAGQPMLTDSETDKLRPVPMTEFFPVKTITKAEAEANKKPDDEGIIQNETFFITRAASKFSFYFFRAKDEFENPLEETRIIQKIKISGLGQYEYLIPKGTEYTVNKITGDRNIINRDIMRFTLASSGEGESPTYPTDDYVFDIPSFNVKDLPVNNGNNPLAGLSEEDLQKCQLIPDMYFPESKGYDYSGTDETGKYNFDCTISFGSDYIDPAQALPNLPHGLPRNTHVVVIVTIHDGYLTATVDVIPFTAKAVTTSDYGLPREEFTGYVIGTDEEGRLCWYDGNYYESSGSNNQFPTNPVTLYLGPIGSEGQLVTIDGKRYMLVYSDPKRKAAQLDHFFEVFTEVKDGVEVAVKSPEKHLLTEAAITGYEYVPYAVAFYLNDMKQRVILQKETFTGTYEEWDLDEFAKSHWNATKTPGLYPKYWFDIFGNRYSVPTPPTYPTEPKAPTLADYGYNSYEDITANNGLEQWNNATAEYNAAHVQWEEDVKDWEEKDKQWQLEFIAWKKTKLGDEWLKYLQDPEVD